MQKQNPPHVSTTTKASNRFATLSNHRRSDTAPPSRSSTVDAPSPSVLFEEPISLLFSSPPSVPSSSFSDSHTNGTLPPIILLVVAPSIDGLCLCFIADFLPHQWIYLDPSSTAIPSFLGNSVPSSSASPPKDTISEGPGPLVALKYSVCPLVSHSLAVPPLLTATVLIQPVSAFGSTCSVVLCIIPHHYFPLYGNGIFV
ncbi:hypothetical protein PIB30_077798 [Stylosanthes scabra]|uniref:Uncharacterized protein n=1 Tax=Stylosanthes scabra TaxID=79078 RepID=A0ABU6VQZ8_9FABA|nr:hypothetical protein [Stylosanthes scabra]